MAYIPEYVLCEHLPNDYKMDLYGDNTYRFYLGDNRLLVLCGICKHAVAYDMVTQFNKDSGYANTGIQYNVKVR